MADFFGNDYGFNGSGSAWDNVAATFSNPDGGTGWDAAAQDMGAWFYNPDDLPSMNVSDPTMQDSGWLDSVWSWATSDKGLNTIAGGIKGLWQMYQQERMFDQKKALTAARGGGGGGGPTAAALQHQRIAAHNKSINKPMDMGMLKLKR